MWTDLQQVKEGFHSRISPVVGKIFFRENQKTDCIPIFAPYKALFRCNWIMIIQFYPQRIHRIGIAYLDRFPVFFLPNHIRFLSEQTLCRQAMRSHLSFPILPGQAVHMCLALENNSPDRFVFHFQRRINIIRTGKCKLYE